MSWTRRLSFVVLVAPLSLMAETTTARSPAFMTGPVVSRSPRDMNPARGALNLIGDIGVSVVDTLAQTTRFTSNLFTLDIEGAFSNLGQIVSKRSVDSLMIQFVQNLPQVLEQDLYVRYSSSSDEAVGSYFTDSKLDPMETAALLNYVLKSNGRSPADAKRIVRELKEAVATMQKGGNKSSQQLGLELGASMKSAMDQAPKPLPILGNPLNSKRRMAISKGFLHGMIQTQGVPYARGTIDDYLEKGKAGGLEVKGLSNDMIRSTMDNALQNLGLRECLEQAKDNAALIVCANAIESNKNKMVGSTFETLGPQLKSGKLGVTLKTSQYEGEVDIGKHLSNALHAHFSEVRSLENTGSTSALNNILNAAVTTVAKDIGDRVVDTKVASHFSSPESAARVKVYGKTIVDEFASRLKVLQGGQALTSQVHALLQGGQANIADNKALDERLKGPFKQTLADADVKAALFGIFLEKAPFSAQLKADFVKNYSDALKKPGALSISPAFPQGLREFVTSFDAAIARVGDVPVSSTIIQHLKGLVDPNSTTLNKIVAGFSPGAKGLVDFYMNCRATDTYCDSLVEPFKTQVAILRDAQKAIEQSSFAANCHEQVSVLVGELMNGVAEMDHNVVSSPTDAVLALASKRSQDSVDCLLPGLAASKGFPQDEAARLYQVLGESRSKRPGDREEIVESLHAYLASPEAGGHAQQDLLSKTEAVGRDLVTDFAKRRVQDFATTPSKIARLAQDEGNHKIIDSIVDRMVANTDLVDENTHLPLKDYLSTLAESPVVRGTSIDKAVDAGLQKTLQDPATRRDVLKLALGIDDALMVKSSGLLGPGLERRMVEAYDKADLRGTNPKFAEGTDPGIATFLKGFDKSVKELDKHRASDESALKFFSNMIKPESRVIDGLVAEQSKGASALLMSMLSCKAGSSELCHACLGSLGNWVVIDPKNGTSEVVAKAPMGKILNFIKAGLQGSDAKINATCAAAIPATLDHIFAQPRTTTRGLGILQDPGLFLDALSQAENQTALNCIVANYAETKVFSKVRDQLAPTEAGVRSLLSHVGMPENSGLMQLTGKKLFETLEKKNSNTELLKRKDVLIAALKADLKNDTSNNRHDMAVAMQDLTRSVMVTTIADPELAYGIVKGGKFPGDLKKWAAGSHDALAQMTLQCVDGRYSSGFMPIALYASEDVSRLVSGALTPWVQDGPQSRYPARVKAPVASSDPTQPASNEACTDAGVFSVNSADLPVKAHSSLMGRVNWVGGYEHTLKSYQDQGRADGSALLSKAGETDALSRTADYQKVINHLRQRKELMANKRPSAGYLKWEMDELGGPAKNVVSDLSSLLRFPIDDIKNALQIYKDSPSVKNRDNLNALLTKNCSDIWTQWSIGNKPITFAEPSALQNSH